ncbi:hypothetical protein, partial [Mesorhizobium sp.]|uniref:hypothetical protein n=1 Tax=Mesorhizobium sp. TaxID=1871066 RepID=UPI0025C25089
MPHQLLFKRPPFFPFQWKAGQASSCPCLSGEDRENGDKLKTGRGIAHPKGGPESAEQIPARAAGRRP